MGVPSITTNLSGFGGFMEDLLEDSQDYGSVSFPFFLPFPLS